MKKNNKIRDINEYKKNKKNKNKCRIKAKIKKHMLIILTTISCLGLIIVNICGYAVIAELKYNIHYLKKELRKEEISLEELKAKVDTNTSIQEIELRAKEQLNMDYPKKNQIKYINIENQGGI